MKALRGLTRPSSPFCATVGFFQRLVLFPSFLHLLRGRARGQLLSQLADHDVTPQQLRFRPLTQPSLKKKKNMPRVLFPALQSLPSPS